MTHQRTTHIIYILLLLLAVSTPSQAQDSDAGLVVSAGASHKINKKFSLGGEIEMRTRNNFKTFDRWAVALNASYKATQWLKLNAGYVLLINNYHEKTRFHSDNSLNTWQPSYWNAAHRVYASATATAQLGRFAISLRERWQYTYRPTTTQQRYDFDDMEWKDKEIESKSRHLLRSRLKVDYDIPKCKIDPFASVECFNDMSLDKTRYTIGVEWKFLKNQSIDLFYRYQDVRLNDATDSSDDDMHSIGLSYNLKF